MSRRILTFMCLTAAVLGLTACSQNSHTNNKDNGRVSSNKNECPPTESIKMSLNVPQDVPQDVTQGFN